MSAVEPIIEFTRAWWKGAAEDLEHARLSPHLPTGSCFHSQQAVEKAAKTLLVLHQVEFAKSHDIGRLLEQLRKTPCSPPLEIAAGLKELSRFAVLTRYPPQSATPAEAKDAFVKAERFLLWVRQQLPKEV